MLATPPKQDRKHSTERRGAYQLGAHTIRGFQRPLIQEVVIAPVPAFLVLLVCMVHIEKSEMITYNSPAVCNMGPAQYMYAGVLCIT